MTGSFDAYTPPTIPRNRIQKPSILTAADTERIRDVRDVFDDTAKSLDDVFDEQRLSDLDVGPGLTNTSQLDIDWSRFENHTFFGSAESNVKVAVDRILSVDEGYPYYGTEEDYQEYLDNQTGYENWVFKNWPTNEGFLNFSGSWYIVARDTSNALLAAERLISGQGTVNPKTGSMTVEFWLNPTGSVALATGTLFDYTNDSAAEGYRIDVLSPVLGTYQLRASMFSGSRTEEAVITIPSTFEHYACVFNRQRELDDIRIYGNGRLSGSSTRLNEIGPIDISGLLFFIGVNHAGSGSPGTDFFSGSVDEFRVWGNVRTPEQLRTNSKRTVRAQDHLNLLYTFNEPSGTTRSIYVIDHSGQEIHGVITGVTGTSGRVTTGSADIGLNPMTYETSEPILFNTYPDIMTLYTRIITDAIQYDQSNPNLITKLVPPEILKMSQTGLDPSLVLDERQQTISQYDNFILGTKEVKASEFRGVLEAFLYVIAKVFDELKIFVDQYKQFGSNSYSGRRFPDKLLDKLLQQYGIDLKGLFSETTLDQFFKGESVQIDGDLVAHSLEEVRAVIWRRVFNSTVGLLKAKGTRESLKGMFRAVGIDPDSNFRIKEFGGFNQATIENRFVRNSRLTPFVDFNSGTAGVQAPAFSLYTSSLRAPQSGFHVEFMVQLPNEQNNSLPQSLNRLAFSNILSGTWDVHAQVVAHSSVGGNPRISFMYQPVSSTLNPITIDVAGEFFDGQIYRVAYDRNLFNSGTYGNVSGTYTLTVNSVEYDDISGPQTNSATGTVNRDMLAVGSGLMAATSVTVDSFFGTNFSTIPEAYNATLPAYTRAEYKLAELHTYDTSIAHPTIRAVHEKNPFSVALDGLGSRLFEETITGLGGAGPIAIANIRPHGELFNVVQFEQSSGSVGNTLPIISSSIVAGGLHGLILTDFAQTYWTMSTAPTIPSGTVSFLSSTLALGTDPRVFRTVNYKELTQDWDRSGADDVDRIAVRTGTDSVYPDPELLPTYDPRVSIDFSVVDAVNDDIVLIMSDMNRLGEAIATYRNRFTYDFTELQYLRRVYFKRLESKIRLQEFFRFFKYFDDNLIDFVLPLIPARVEFLGGRFVVEPHALERSKYVYQDYNGLFTAGNSPREIRDLANVGVLEASMSPVGSEPGGLTGDILHRGGAQVTGASVQAISPSGGTVRVESVIVAPSPDYTLPVYGPNKIEQRRFIDFDEAMPISYRYTVFTKGDYEFMRFLFGQETF